MNDTQVSYGGILGPFTIGRLISGDIAESGFVLNLYYPPSAERISINGIFYNIKELTPEKLVIEYDLVAELSDIIDQHELQTGKLTLLKGKSFLRYLRGRGQRL